MSERLHVQLGRVIRAARLSRGLSQERLAQRAGIDRTYISGLERGVRNPSLDTLHKVAVALDVEIRDLFRDIAS